MWHQWCWALVHIQYNLTCWLTHFIGRRVNSSQSLLNRQSTEIVWHNRNILELWKDEALNFILHINTRAIFVLLTCHVHHSIIWSQLISSLCLHVTIPLHHYDSMSSPWLSTVYVEIQYYKEVTVMSNFKISQLFLSNVLEQRLWFRHSHSNFTIWRKLSFIWFSCWYFRYMGL